MQVVEAISLELHRLYRKKETAGKIYVAICKALWYCLLLKGVGHAKDSSKKVRVVKRMQAERGELLGGRPPYGYRRDETVRKGIVSDEEAAAVVKRIFSLCAEGKGPNQIAKRRAGKRPHKQR
jgi:hypothetical protein